MLRQVGPGQVILRVVRPHLHHACGAEAPAMHSGRPLASAPHSWMRGMRPLLRRRPCGRSGSRQADAAPRRHDDAMDADDHDSAQHCLSCVQAGAGTMKWQWPRGPIPDTSERVSASALGPDGHAFCCQATQDLLEVLDSVATKAKTGEHHERIPHPCFQHEMRIPTGSSQKTLRGSSDKHRRSSSQWQSLGKWRRECQMLWGHGGLLPFMSYVTSLSPSTRSSRTSTERPIG